MAKIRHHGFWRQNAKTRFSGKLSNLEVWCLLSTYRKLCNRAFQRTHYWIPRKDGWDPPSWKSTWRHFFCRRWSDLYKISETGTEWHVNGGDVAEIETKYRIPIWRTFGRIQWHVILEPRRPRRAHCRVLPHKCELTITIPEPHAALQGVRISSAILKIVFRHILFF